MAKPTVSFADVISHSRRFLPWHANVASLQETTGAEWIEEKKAELISVNVTGVLLAGVGSSAFSWPVIESAPWTTQAALYASLITAMIAVSSGTQQYVTLSRIRGERLRVFQALLRGDKAIQSHHLYVWQMPIMLLSFSIWYLLIGLLILIYARAAASSPWGPDVKIAVVSGLATIFAFGNYLIGAATVYRLNAHLYSGKHNISVDPPVVQTSASWP
ncbi:hypothetical protein AA0112_g8537 [Alternaria arborescens]|nr:hypothetical protein AA0112_g8537 [Alternaria arborescens]